MPSPNHNIIAQSISDRSVNSLIEKALDKAQIQTTPQNKRKPSDQLSSEKTKPPKIINSFNTANPTEKRVTTTNTASKTQSNTTKMGDHSDRPKMLRHTAKGLEGTPCISAYFI